jgi:hypothetical protein
VLCLLVCVLLWWRSQAKIKRRRQQLEDVQTVFQTETWRKLE